LTIILNLFDEKLSASVAKTLCIPSSVG